MNNAQTLSEALAIDFTQRLLLAAGAESVAAISTAESLVRAEAVGCATHGLRLASVYVDGLLESRIVADAKPKVIVDRPCFIGLDGGNGLGPHVLRHASRLATRRAKAERISNGICSVAVRRSGHVGRLAEAVEQAASDGCIVWAVAGTGLVASDAVVAAPGGGRRLLGTNPVAFAAPADNGEGGTFVFDFSTASAAFYRVLLAAEAGDELPPGCLVDGESRPTNDPQAFLQGGAIQPTGGYKGFASSLACLLLAALGDPECENSTLGESDSIEGLFLQVIDVATWVPLDAYRSRISHFLDKLREEFKNFGPAGARVPGDRTSKAANSARALGLRPAQEVAIQLIKRALRLGVQTPPALELIAGMESENTKP